MPLSSKLPPAYVFPPVFRVFEHELLRVGEERDGRLFSERQLESLVELSERTGARYFSLGHRSVRFKNFVGILATTELTIEILPKADRRTTKEGSGWQQVLIDLLRACQFVRTENPGAASVDSRPGDLFDWYVRSFIAELQALLRHGLLHAYETKTENLTVLKGRLQLARQLRHNAVHRERFFVQHDRFTARHPANLLIAAALERLRYLSLSPELKVQVSFLIRLFPPLNGTENLSKILTDRFSRDRRLDRYAPSLTIARHILHNEQPDIRAGTYRGIALLFDMNLLFEEYLYRQLLQWKPEKVRIERQQSRVFWGRNRLRPDLVVSGPAGRWVLDTKWRLPDTLQPTADELRQIYVYCEYFNAQHGVLIFPRTDREQGTPMQIFAPRPGQSEPERSCRLYFAAVLTPEGRLNRELGKELFDALISGM